METERRLVRLADGRDIEYQTAGPADGLALVVHEGTPMGLVLNSRLGNAAGERGLRDRAGRAARLRGVDAAARPRRWPTSSRDVVAVLDDLGADEFVSIGFSGGGPHTLACAALAPGRCLATASVAGVAPYARRGPGLPGRHGAGEHRGVRPRGPRR